MWLYQIEFLKYVGLYNVLLVDYFCYGIEMGKKKTGKENTLRVYRSQFRSRKINRLIFVLKIF